MSRDVIVSAPLSTPPPPSVGLHVLHTRTVSSKDGTRIAYYTTAAPFAGAPTVILANGLGGPRRAWHSLIDSLAERYRFVTWDYRGLYGSERPVNSHAPDAYSIERHVEDLDAVLAEVGVDNTHLVGWSMGVQVCLEAYRRRPELVRSLVLMNGTFGRPLDTAVPSPWARHAVQPALSAVLRYADPLQRALRTVAAQPEFVSWMKRLGMMAETVEDTDFSEMVSMWRELDLDSFVRNLRALAEHDASRMLEGIGAPVLVITGDRDRMTPHGLSRQMVRRIPNAEILVVRGGTHYTTVEFPELVALRIERFYRDHAV